METIDELLSTFRPSQHDELQRIRKIIANTAPKAEESISYGMPAFKYKHKYLIGYSAFKDHLSIFPGAEATAVFKTRLTDFVTSKGTIQFSETHPLPDDLLEDIVKLGLQRIDSGK